MIREFDPFISYNPPFFLIQKPKFVKEVEEATTNVKKNLSSCDG